MFILLLAANTPACTFVSGIEDTKKEKDKARTFDEPAGAGTGGVAGSAGAGGQPTVNLDGGAGGTDPVGAAGTDAGAAGTDAGGQGGSS